MNLRGIELGPMQGFSGVQGFFGHGYPFHRIWTFSRWFDFTGMTEVGKTMTMPPTEGNMPLSDEYPFEPQEWFPRCIWVSWRRRIVLNVVGLTNPGAEVLLRYDQPVVISFMSVAKTSADRLEEARAFVEWLMRWRAAHPGVVIVLQFNFSCPNAGHDPTELLHEALVALGIVEELDIPVMAKINVLAPIEMIREIAEHRACDALVLSNSVPFGQNPVDLKHQIDWRRYFPDGASPLTKRGFASPGGLSGEPLLLLVAERLEQIRDAGIDIPICAGGGILKPDDVDLLVGAGLRREVDAVAMASVALLAPWNIQPIIHRAHKLLG
ncbi:hypothetical protein FJY94_03250 [Candidatus Kaiserbacteria bacterium]|nr:hypothetical protein [Candidatus Kaiserbacteria bacterium]